MIQVEHVKYSYHGREAVLKDICLTETEGHFLALLGNNGAGKSTFLKCINRILEAQGGVIQIDGSNVKSLSRGAIAKKIAYVEQHTGTSRLTVYDTVLLGRKPHMKFSLSEEDYRIADNAIERMKLNDYRIRYTDELSGGELQKVVLARALAQQPEVLLLDEPTASLDLLNQHEVMRNVSEIVKRDSILAIIVIHDLNLALQYCDRFMLIKDGCAYQYGDSSVITEEIIRDVYGINASIIDINNRKMVVVNSEV